MAGNWGEIGGPILWAAFALGAIHIASPDHWFPVSLMAWQRGWSRARIWAVGISLWMSHLALAGGVALILHILIRAQDSWRAPIFAGSLLFCVAAGAVRIARARWLPALYRSGHAGQTGFFGPWGSAWRFLGPAETLVPVMLKAFEISPSVVAQAFGLYAGASALALGLLVWRALAQWQKPSALSSSLRFFPSWRYWLPVGAGWAAVVVGAVRFLAAP